MSENKLPAAPSIESVNGPTGVVSAHRNVSPKLGGQSSNISYPEGEPNVGVKPGPVLSYSGGKKAGSDNSTY